MRSEITQSETMSLERQLILTLKTMYAQQFAKHFTDMPMNIIENIVRAALMGVDGESFNKGMARLLSGQSKFMPTVQEFKSWCMSSTWSSTEAWYHVCEWSRDSKHKITVMAKQCWDEVYHIVLDGNMKEAQRQFVNLYEDRVTRAQLHGAKQEVYVPPIAIPVQTMQQEYRAVGEQDSNHLKAVENLTKKYMAELGLSIVQAGMRAAKELKGVTV